MQLEVVEGKQGKNHFYSGTVPVGRLEQIVRFADEIEELDEDKKMQRALATSRIRDLVRYLTDYEDHFFSAVTLIILPRDLDRSVRAFDDDEEEGDYSFTRIATGLPGRSRTGVLYLSGDVILFPGDGQHRLKAEFEAIKEKPAIAKEELPVVLLPYESTDQVRQLFSDLNLNAKPVSKSVGYHFETRDPVVLVAKAIANGVELFEGRVNKKSNSLAGSSRNVIALATLVKGTETIVEALAFKAGVTSEEYLDERDAATAEVASVWQAIIDAFEPRWAPVLADEPRAAGDLREQFVFPHGLGWQGLAVAAARLIEKRGLNRWRAPFKRAIGEIDWRRTAAVWEGNAVIHDPQTGRNRVNNTGSAIRELADLIVEHAEAS